LKSNTQNIATKVSWDYARVSDTIYVEEVKEYNAGLVYALTKRGLDIVGSILGLVILFIPFILICTIIVADSPGGPFYSQVRLGKDEKPFRLYKFRTMNIDAEADEMKWAEDNDPRVTKIGKFLRKTRLDELPQLINILAGQMSLVGPRPERPEFYDIFDTYIVGYRQRMKVLPGLTGYAQVMGGYDLQPEEKIVYDIEYIENQSLRMDLYCILKTFGVVFTGNGAR
jgi:lipopolysaccharide/colanic/teichoic acid biosynthesis glycosyltransferase